MSGERIPPENLGNAFINVNYVDLTFNEQSEELTIEIESDDSKGEIANLIHMILTPGEMPRGEATTLHVYLDASKEIVNIFTYNLQGDMNCTNSPGSWEKAASFFNVPAEGLLSTIGINSSDITEPLFVSNTTNQNGTTRLIRTSIDLSNINQFESWSTQPPFNRTFEGLSFGENVGVWLWAASDAVTSYDETTGFLNSLTMNTCAICDHRNFETESALNCKSSSASINPVSEEKSTIR